jgi:hypothetical protein
MRIDLEHADNLSHWRKRAARLRALAKITHRRADRDELNELAKQWEGLAAQAERKLRQKLTLR